MTPERELLRLALTGPTPKIRQSSKTRAEYAADWKTFSAWCREHGQPALPTTQAIVLTYCHDLLSQGRKVATCQRHLSGINSFHREAGLPAPATQETRQFLTAVKRLRGEQTTQKRAVTLDQLRALVIPSADDTAGVRDRAVLLLGFSSALRRSNLVALDLADLRFHEQGLVLTIRREKQDRSGQGRILGVAYGTSRETCAAAAVHSWIGVRGETPGPLFTPVYHGRVVLRRLHPERIARIVKTAVAGLGLDATDYAGHSLRSGFVTTCLESGLNEIVIAAHVGHSSLSTTRRYFRRADPFRANPSGKIGL